VLSRLIALLRRLPAVQWAFTRLQPARITAADVAPTAAESAATAMIDHAGMTSACCAEAGSSAEPSPVISPDAAPVVAESAAVVNVADMTSTCPAGDSACTPCADSDAVVAAESLPCSVDTAREVAVTAASIDSAPSGEAGAETAPVMAEPAATGDIAAEAPTAAHAIGEDEAPSRTIEEAQPIAADAAATDAFDPAQADAADRPDICIGTADVEVETAPAAIAEAAEPAAVATTADSEPVPPPASPTEETRDRPTPPVKAADPVDRTALIRQRWAETGIRMWNPRLHGTGDAALNIQGRIELLPPAPGETLPRYDKLEFRMLGGQIVCEGVIVEAPVLAGHRSFTRLERRQTDRAREAEPA
jgi:hypothetical protein